MFANIRALHTHSWAVLLTRFPVLANTRSLFSGMFFWIYTDVTFVQLHQKHESDITDLIKYVATPRRGHSQVVSLARIIQKWSKYSHTKRNVSTIKRTSVEFPGIAMALTNACRRWPASRVWWQPPIRSLAVRTVQLQQYCVPPARQSLEARTTPVLDSLLIYR